jgi:hypothetical protein
MMISLAHFDLGPLIYGVVMFFGIAIIWWKLTSGRWLSFVVDICVFTLVFTLHGGTMAGGFAAMVAALLAGLFLPSMMRR